MQRVIEVLLVAAAAGPLASAAQVPWPAAVLTGAGPMVLGEVQGFELRAPGWVGAPYVAACALAPEPGITTPLGLLGLVPDSLFLLSLGAGGPFVGFLGVLDGVGSAALGIALPADPGLAGLSLTVAAAVLDPGAPQGLGSLSNSIQRRARVSAVPQDFAAVDAVLAAFSDGFAFGHPGIAFAFVQNGKIVHASGFGGFEPSTRVRLGSATKWFSATGLMRLVDAGVLELDGTLAAELNTFGGAKSAITYRQAFAHTSGLPAQAPCLGNLGTTLSACAATIGLGFLPNSPGTVFNYGGASMQAAGAAMESVVGAGFEAWFLAQVSGPLGASSFAFDGLGTTLNPRVAGGGKASALDLAALLLAMLEGGAVGGEPWLSTEAVLTLLADQTAGASFTPGVQPGAVGYGLGVWIESVDTAGRSAVVSSPGAFGAYPWIDRVRGYGAVVLLDRNLADARAVRDALLPLLEALADQG
jgi:CubicO group peptidase (beta-lactamase class C family)